MLPDLSQYEPDEEEVYDFEETVYPDRTYYMNPIHKVIVGYIDGEESLQQAIWKILQTEALEYEIYSESYGIELNDLYGMGKSFVNSEIKNRIESAILLDKRFESVEFTEERFENGKYILDFIVTTADQDEISMEGVELSV